MSDDAPETAENPEQPPRDDPRPAEEPSESAKPLHCSHCGAEMLAEDRFCHNCRWDSEAPRPSAPRRDLGPASNYSRLTAFLLCLLLGFLGVHRFYVGKIGTGLLWLFTLGFLSVGLIYDLVLIGTGEFRDSRGLRLLEWQ